MSKRICSVFVKLSALSMFTVTAAATGCGSGGGGSESIPTGGIASIAGTTSATGGAFSYAGARP